MLQYQLRHTWTRAQQFPIKFYILQKNKCLKFTRPTFIHIEYIHTYRTYIQGDSKISDYNLGVPCGAGGVELHITPYLPVGVVGGD